MSIYITCLYCLIITIMGLGCTSHQKKRFYEHNVSESVMTYPILTCKHKMFLWSFWKTCYNTHHLSPFRIPFILNRQHTNRQIPSKRPCKQSIFPAFSQYWNMVACNPCTKFWHFFGATNTGIFFKFWHVPLEGSWKFQPRTRLLDSLYNFTPLSAQLQENQETENIDHRGLHRVYIKHQRVQVVEKLIDY